MDGKIISLRPLVVKGSPKSPISWGCGASTPPKGMIAVGQDKTDIPNEYLFGTCSSKVRIKN